MASVTLFSVRGIPVRIHASWLIVFGLIAWTLSVGYFPDALPHATPVTYWLTGLAAALLLFVSVFVHELSHSLVALRYGLRVSSITLHVFGGVSRLEDEPRRPGMEFTIAAVGPLTSFALAAVAAAGARIAVDGSAADAVLKYLTLVNVVVGVFNLVPGFPLDGGRILRAALWRMRGNLAWATRIAGAAGSAVALALIGLGVLRAFTGDFLGGLWFVLIGVFLRQAAASSYHQLLLRRTLEGLKVGDIMTRDVVTVTPDAPIASVVDDVFWPHHVTSFPVVGPQGVVGILHVQAVGQLPRHEWAETPVRSVMRPVSEQLTTSPQDTVWAAFEKLGGNGLGRLAVIENGGRLVGYLSIKDVMHVLALSAGEASTPTFARRTPPEPPPPLRRTA